MKPQLTTVGMHPAAVDFGAEADLVSSIAGEKPEPQSHRWNTSSAASSEPRRASVAEGGPDEGTQMHSPPAWWAHLDEWRYIGVATPTAQIN